MCQKFLWALKCREVARSLNIYFFLDTSSCRQPRPPLWFCPLVRLALFQIFRIFSFEFYFHNCPNPHFIVDWISQPDTDFFSCRKYKYRILDLRAIYLLGLGTPSTQMGIRNSVEYAQKCEQIRRRSYRKICDPPILQSYRDSRSIQILLNLYNKISANTRDKNGSMRGVLYNYVHKKKSNKVPYKYLYKEIPRKLAITLVL